jgi:hypothetical protein
MEKAAQHFGHIMTEIMLQVVGAVDGIELPGGKLGELAAIEDNVGFAHRVDVEKDMLEASVFGRKLDRLGAATHIEKTLHGGRHPKEIVEGTLIQGKKQLMVAGP